MWTFRIFLIVLITSVLFQDGICAAQHNDLKSEVKAMVAEMLAEYQSTIQTLKSEVYKLNTEVIHQNAKIRELDNKIVKLTGEQPMTFAKPILDVQNDQGTSRKINETGDKMGNVPYPNQMSEGKQTHTDIRKWSVRHGGAIKRRELPENVAFCSYLDHELTHLAIGQTIKYNQVILNDGGSYNTHTGVFTVPITGVYLFMFHYDTIVGKTEIRLVVDDVNVVGSVVDHVTGIENLMGGNSAIIHVTRGQAVWTEPYYVNDQALSSAADYRKTTFSGVLLYTTQ